MAVHVINEANRCLNCKKPMCMQGCPIHTPIPMMIKAFKEGNLNEAGEMLFENNPMSMICSLVCNHENQCEGHCVLGRKGEPVHISSIENYVSDTYFDKMQIPCQPKNGKKVAVIGAGPAGMLEPESQYNPFVDISCRKRNQLIILILQETGMRGGELLNLKISDFNKEKRYLKVCKRVNDPADPRVFQPLVKTFERELNISKKLSMQISSYIDNDRSFYSKSLNHNYLFITQKSGPTEGFPLSISAYHKVIKQISRIEFNGVSFQNFTGHCLRHTWNYIYSLKYIGVTDQYRLTQLDRIRCVRMGWKMNSKTALIYNNRYISEETLKAFEEVDLVNNKIINKIEGEIDESINVRKLLGIKGKRQQK